MNPEIEKLKLDGFKFDKQGEEIFYINFLPFIDYNLCPKCNSNNNHKYNDCFVCFDCKLMVVRGLWEIYIDDIYLARKNKELKKIEYFHRFLIEYIYQKKLQELVVHHINHNHSDNRLINLKIMTIAQHKEHHEMSKAYETYVNTKYGSYSEEHWDEFIQWKNKKEDENEYYT